MTIVLAGEELPSMAAPRPRNQVLIGTALAAVAGSTLLGGMLGVWLLMRERVVSTGARFPLKYVITEVSSNVMLMTVWAAAFFALWAWYSGRENDRGHAVLAVSLSALLGVAFINAQAFVWYSMEVPINADYYGPLLYAVTGTMVAIVVAALVYSLVAIFQSLTARAGGSGVLLGCLVWWLFTSLAYSAVWFVVYVTK